MNSLSRPERDALLNRARQIDAQIYPADTATAPKGQAAAKLREEYYRILAEYADRLPRVTMSCCPFTGTPLKRSFDPWGLDGPWWHYTPEVEIEEPLAPPAFKVLLGAVAFHGRTPSDARQAVTPGPEVPFVVPRLLGLPGMVAVISSLKLATGDTAYPIAYFSESDIPHNRLHQFWLRQDYWFKTAEGRTGWIIANDTWDFELKNWIASGKLRWIDLQDLSLRVQDGNSDKPCPFLDMPGDRAPQNVAFGKRNSMDLPDGTPVNPFEE
jgi:hypothetical protein